MVSSMVGKCENCGTDFKLNLEFTVTPPVPPPPPPPPVASVLLNSNFESATVASPISTADMWATIGSQTGGSSIFTRTSIQNVTGRGKVLQQHFTAGKYSTGDGIAMSGPLVRRVDEATITYDFRFVAGGSFGWGGKLPGLGGVRPGYGNPPAGGHPTPNGFSSRLMHIAPQAGFSSESPLSPSELIAYVYDPTLPEGWGVNRRSRKALEIGVWYRASQHLRMNTIKSAGIGNADGLHEIFVDGVLCFRKTNQIFRLFADGNISHIVWDLFYGGNTVDWAPRTDTNVQLDNLLITTP